MAVAGLIIAAVGAAISAAGAAQQSKYQKSMGEYQSKVSAQNAQQVMDQAAGEEASFRKKARAQWGSNIAGIGASGMRMQGSPLLIMSEFEAETEKEAGNITSGALSRAGDYMTQGSMYGAAGKNAYSQGMMGAGATLLQGASSIYGTGAQKGYWGKAKKTKTNNS